MFELINELCAANGTSGDEKEVSELIVSKLPGDCEITRDRLGNLIVFKKGKQPPKNKVMLAAHMDEVGFIITYITDSGFLKFAAVGGINSETIIGRQVTLKNGIIGVIGTKAVHQQSESERNTPVKTDSMYIDIGAASKEEAEKYVALGDTAYFIGDACELGNNMLTAKALDDRIGCAIMIEMLKTELPYDITCVFTVQEEIGTRGARAAAYNVNPDYAIVLETTTACDFAGVEGEKKVCCLGKGAVVSYMDRSTIYSRKLYAKAFDIAKENDIAVQTKTVVAGGNDSGAIHTSVGGIETIAISVPCRYLHSPVCMINKDDVTASFELAVKMFAELCSTDD